MLNIMVVDDSRIVRRVVTQMLAALSYRTFEAENGQEALDDCAQRMPDGIILDWNMPVMDGITFLRALRASPGGDRPKVIFCTSEGDLARITTALEAGADEYIMKPFDAEVLASKLTIVGLLTEEDGLAA